MSKIQKPNIYMEDLYNFCCLKTSIFKNNQKKANNKIKNNILKEINNNYEEIMKYDSIHGYNYSLLYEGEIPELIIKELNTKLTSYFYNFKIVIKQKERSFLDKLLMNNIYHIFILWNDNINPINDNITPTNNNDNNNDNDNDNEFIEINDDLIDIVISE